MARPLYQRTPFKVVRSTTVGFLIVVMIGAVTGCGTRPEVPVHGTVTLDGAPLANALVSFQPQEPHGEPAFATTDADGFYQAYGGSGRSAVAVGAYKVAISTLRHDDDNPSWNAPERVPAKYNTQSSLIVEVGLEERGKQLDFVLDRH
jgi:hypothetical protein